VLRSHCRYDVDRDEQPPAHMHTSQEVGLSGFDPTIALLILLGSLVALTLYLLTRSRQPADVVLLDCLTGYGVPRQL
jgi:hypothetical protein